MSLKTTSLPMGKEHKKYAWNLIAKKLAGDATSDELTALESLLRNNPELHYPMQTMTDVTAERSVKAENKASATTMKDSHSRLNDQPAKPGQLPVPMKATMAMTGTVSRKATKEKPSQ